MKLKIKKRVVEFENENVYIVLIDFGISFYVWVGRNPSIDELAVSFPLPENRYIHDNLASTSLLGEGEICKSISSYLCKKLKAPILASINIDSIEIDSKNINQFKQMINNNIVSLIGE